MHQLRSCDFCGGDAAGTFEIVPPELEPTEAEQRRVVLCGRCKARLEPLLEPLLARAGADVDVDAEATVASGRSDTADASSRPERTADSDDSVPGSGDDIDRPGAESETGPGISSSPGITVEPGDSTTADPDDRVSHGTSDTTSNRDRQRASDIETNAVGSEADTDRDGEIGGDGEGKGEGEDGREAERTVSSSSETDASTAGSSETESESRSRGRGQNRSDGSSDDRTRTQSRSESPSASRSSTHSPPAAETEGPPRAYSKVVRLLRNREFPMDRSAVESLAAGAYELENDEVGAIVDHAIERGEFRADGEKLYRPSS